MKASKAKQNAHGESIGSKFALIQIKFSFNQNSSKVANLLCLRQESAPARFSLNVGMPKNPDEPFLHYFRARPRDFLAHPPLASSLQSFESFVFQIALRRFPHALVSLATAIESSARAKLRLPRDDQSKFADLLQDLQSMSPALKMFSREKLDAFRRKRNDVIHYGFSPRDDADCATLILSSGLPFLKRCYSELFDFYLDWKDVRAGIKEFRQLSSDEMDKVGLFPEFANQLRVATDVYVKARDFPRLEAQRFFVTFGHYIELGIKESMLTEAENEMIQKAEEIGVGWQQKEKQKEAIRTAIRNECVDFDCPVCGGAESAVVELDEKAIEAAIINPRRILCVQCALVVPLGIPLLAEVALDEQLKKRKAEILASYGVHVKADLRP